MQKNSDKQTVSQERKAGSKYVIICGKQAASSHLTIV